MIEGEGEGEGVGVVFLDNGGSVMGTRSWLLFLFVYYKLTSMCCVCSACCVYGRAAVCELSGDHGMTHGLQWVYI